MNAAVREVETPVGPARVHLEGTGEHGFILIGHGAGGSSWPADLREVHRAAVSEGWRSALVDQPWRVAGKRVAAPPATLDCAWVAVAESLVPEGAALVVSGRSAGARVACRTAATVGAAAVLAVSFPLHPPGRPDRSRAEEAREPGRHGIPVHLVHGERDPFGSPEEVAAALPGLPLTLVVAAHSISRADAVQACGRVVAEVLRSLAS